MSIFNAFFEIEKKEEKINSSEQNKTTSTSIPNNYYSNTNDEINSSINNNITDVKEISSNMMNNFKEILNSENLPGPDLKEVLDSVLEFSDVPDEQKYKMVFTILSKNGLTIQKIEESYNTYKNAIEKNSNLFESEIVTKQNEIQNNLKRIPAIEKEISSLKEKINSLEIEKSNLEKESSNFSLKIDFKRKEYNLARNYWLNLLTDTYTKIKQFNNK